MSELSTLARYAQLSDVSASWRAVGGCWELTATWTADAGPAAAVLTRDAPLWLGTDVEIDAWQWWGTITQIDITTGRLKRRYSLTQRYANRVAIVYSGGITAWAENAGEVGTRGEWERVETDSGLDATQAADLRDRLLARGIAEQPFALGVNRSHEPGAEVRITALGFLPAAARFASGYAEGAGTIGYQIAGAGEALSTALAGVLTDTDLTVLYVEANATTVTPEEVSGRNAWSRLEELAIWDGRAAYTLTADSARRVTYAPVSADIAYQITPSAITLNGVHVTPRTARPGSYRDAETGATLYIDEVIWADGDDWPELRPADVQPDAYLGVE